MKVRHSAHAGAPNAPAPAMQGPPACSAVSGRAFPTLCVPARMTCTGLSACNTVAQPPLVTLCVCTYVCVCVCVCVCRSAPFRPDYSKAAPVTQSVDLTLATTRRLGDVLPVRAREDKAAPTLSASACFSPDSFSGLRASPTTNNNNSPRNSEWALLCTQTCGEICTFLTRSDMHACRV